MRMNRKIKKSKKLVALSQRGTDTPVVVLCNVRHASGCSVQGEAVQCTVGDAFAEEIRPWL